MVAANYQQVLAWRGVPSRWVVVNAAVAHVQAIDDGVAYRRAALDDPPTHTAYVMTGAAVGNGDVGLMLCRRLDLFTDASVAIDGSKFKAVNNRDRNFTKAKMERRLAPIEESVARYLHQLDSADRQKASQARTTKTARLNVHAARG